MKEFTFKVSSDDVMLIGSALGQLPHDKVRGLIDSLQFQINEQNKQDKEEVKTDAE